MLNDLIRPGFAAAEVVAEMARMFAALTSAGAQVVTVTLPDIGRIAPLARPLRPRVLAFNARLTAADQTSVDQHAALPQAVAESPAAIECTVHTTLALGDSTVVIGRVRHVAIDESMVQGNHPEITRPRPLARLGKDEWSTLGEVRSITRIRHADWPGHVGRRNP